MLKQKNLIPIKKLCLKKNLIKTKKNKLKLESVVEFIYLLRDFFFIIIEIIKNNF